MTTTDQRQHAATRGTTSVLQVVTVLFLVAASVAAHATSPSQKALMERVHSFLYQHAEGDDILIDVHMPSAHLPACELPQPFLVQPDAPLMGRIAVGVRCGAEGRQVRYLQADITVIGSYVVAAVDIPAGTTVSEQHLTTATGNLAQLPRHTALKADEIIGQQARRALRAGSTLQTTFFSAPTVVHRGQSVMVEAGGAHFRISREGEAMEPGTLGQRIRVRFGPRDIITATVSGDGRLTVEL